MALEKLHNKSGKNFHDIVLSIAENNCGHPIPLGLTEPWPGSGGQQSVSPALPEPIRMRPD